MNTRDADTFAWVLTVILLALVGGYWYAGAFTRHQMFRGVIIVGVGLALYIGYAGIRIAYHLRARHRGAEKGRPAITDPSNQIGPRAPYLFLGGPADGELRYTDGQTICYVPRGELVGDFAPLPRPPLFFPQMRVVVHRYRRVSEILYQYEGSEL